MQKKAQVNKLTGFVLTLVVFTLVLGIGFSIMSKMRDSQRTTDSAFDSNTTFTAINATAVTFGVGDQLTCTGVKIKNGSNLADVTSSFTVSNCAATLSNININNTVLTANYTYTYYVLSSSYNATAANISHMNEIPGWIPVIIVAMIGGLILFLVIKQFGAK